MQFMSTLWIGLVSILLLNSTTPGYAEDAPGAQPHVHEAFITPVRADIALEPIDRAPPVPIRELTPAQIDADTIWIPGYWEWDVAREDFVWVSGIWRRPPPDKLWIPGQWSAIEDNQWVWVQGFWSSQPADQLNYISIPPPDPVTEELDEDEGAEDTFWISGCWEYQTETQSYTWRNGYWEKRDPDWILVPCHYRWRAEGYIRIEAYWDWPLEDRGHVYTPVYIEPEQRNATYVYQPKESYTTIQIVQQLFPSYPDYLTCYDYYSYYYPNYWEGYAPTPPWWRWRNWWSMGWQNHWALWWWYNHPNYPQPVWVTPAIAASLPPPPVAYARFFTPRYRPYFITPFGVVTSGVLFRERNELYGWRGRAAYRPFLPRQRHFWERVNRHIERQMDRHEARDHLRPNGNWDRLARERPPRAPNRAVDKRERGEQRATRNRVEVPRRPAVRRSVERRERREQQIERRAVNTPAKPTNQIQQPIRQADSELDKEQRIQRQRIRQIREETRPWQPERQIQRPRQLDRERREPEQPFRQQPQRQPRQQQQELRQAQRPQRQEQRQDRQQDRQQDRRQRRER